MATRRWAVAAVSLVAGVSPDVGATPSTEADEQPQAWWKEAVFYEIYPRSFMDSNGDGVGDLEGIRSKLGYLRELGIDAVWLTPCFPSPQVDFGYDVSDYKAVDPRFGSMQDMERLLAEARGVGIRIVLDLVLNHTSDQHPWFRQSRSSRSSPLRDWYIWRDGKPDHRPPNNWSSTFGGSAWAYDGTTRQYYYHYFYAEQPDLNWRNREVETAMLDVTRWWYAKGVAGFRLDAVDTLFEDPALADNPPLPGRNKFGDPNQIEIRNKRLPEVHDVLKKLRKVADESNAVLIGETWTNNIEELKEYYGEGGNELQMPMDFLFTMVNKLSAAEFRRQIAAAERTGGWPVYVLGNHDTVRSYDRYGDGRNDDAIAKLMGAFYLTLRGTPILYYGEEIGMRNHDPKRPEDVRDPIGRRGWPVEKGRDGERTPMQWSTSRNAGFSTGHPWLAIPPSFATHNVATEEQDESSILTLYKKVLALRRTNPALRAGAYRALNEDDTFVLSYLRHAQGTAVLVALNMSDKPRTAEYTGLLQGQPHKAAGLRPLVATQGSGARGTTVDLGPFGVLIAQVEPGRSPGKRQVVPAPSSKADSGEGGRRASPAGAGQTRRTRAPRE